MSGFQITAPHFVAGIELEASRVVKTAPILEYMKGWSFAKVLVYCDQRNWKLTSLQTGKDYPIGECR